MNTFQKAMSTVGIILAMTAVPAGAAPPPPTTTPIPPTFKVDGFEFSVLPYDKCVLTPVDVQDTTLGPLCLPLKVAREGSGGKLSRREWIKKVTDACANAKGVLQDGGSKVSCTLPAKPTNNTKSVKQPPPGDDPDALNCPPNCLKTANPTNVGNQTKK